ncbi:hypothetical protein [Burkholderia ubonensis]|uniref:hypothetical protein n=1 Tax=Burkholderia ubonensis TaxID=101571 RepID=UPI0009B36C6B
MDNIVRIGVDLAKNVMQVHAVDSTERVVVRKAITRQKFLTWFANLELCLAVEAGAAPVVLLRQTPFYHAPNPMRREARLQSPYGLLTSRPASISRFRQVRRFCNVDFATCVMQPLRDAAGKARILTAIDTCQ